MTSLTQVFHWRFWAASWGVRSKTRFSHLTPNDVTDAGLSLKVLGRFLGNTLWDTLLWIYGVEKFSAFHEAGASSGQSFVPTRWVLCWIVRFHKGFAYRIISAWNGVCWLKVLPRYGRLSLEGLLGKAFNLRNGFHWFLHMIWFLFFLRMAFEHFLCIFWNSYYRVFALQLFGLWPGRPCPRLSVEARVSSQRAGFCVELFVFIGVLLIKSFLLGIRKWYHWLFLSWKA